VDLDRRSRERTKTVDLVLVESLEALDKQFSAKCRVFSMIICRSRAEDRRAKVRFGCLRDRKVLREDLASVSSRDHLGRWFEGSACAG
jgi:hypothetical protein